MHAIPSRDVLHCSDAPIALVWFTCARDLAAVRISAESAVDLVPAGSSFHLVFDHTELNRPEVQQAVEAIRGMWPNTHSAASTVDRRVNLNGAAWVCEQFRQWYNALQLNPAARYVLKIDSDVVMFNANFRGALRPERFVMVGQASRWRGMTSAWGAMYFLHRDYVNTVTADPDPVGLLEQMNAACGLRFGDYPEDQTVSQLAVHLYKRDRVWFRPEGDWVTALVGRWHYIYPDHRDRDHYWFYDALEYGMLRQIVPKYGVDGDDAFTMRDQTMARHLEASRVPRKYSKADRERYLHASIAAEVTGSTQGSHLHA